MATIASCWLLAFRFEYFDFGTLFHYSLVWNRKLADFGLRGVLLAEWSCWPIKLSLVVLSDWHLTVYRHVMQQSSGGSFVILISDKDIDDRTKLASNYRAFKARPPEE